MRIPGRVVLTPVLLLSPLTVCFPGDGTSTAALTARPASAAIEERISAAEDRESGRLRGPDHAGLGVVDGGPTTTMSARSEPSRPPDGGAIGDDVYRARTLAVLILMLRQNRVPR
jgi:hypothetical protein